VIGSVVKWTDEYGSVRNSEVIDIASDMYESVLYEEGVYKYWSKKTKSFRPVKDKNIDSLYLELKGREYNDFIYLKEII